MLFLYCGRIGGHERCVLMVCGLCSACRAFNEAALSDFESFSQQKIADFRSVLINLAQLEIQLHRKVLPSVCVCMLVHVCVHTRVCVHAQLCVYVCVHVCVCSCMNDVCVCMCVCSCVL